MYTEPAIIVVVESKLRALIAEECERALARALVEASRRDRAARADWVTVKEAARLYGRSRSTIWRWRRAGLLAEKVLGGTVYVRRLD